MYFVYILYSARIDKYYIGYSSNVNVRLLKHNTSNSGFTSTGKPWIVVYTEAFKDKKTAMTRERQIKNWKNKYMISNLINSGSEHPD